MKSEQRDHEELSEIRKLSFTMIDYVSAHIHSKIIKHLDVSPIADNNIKEMKNP